MLPLTARLAAVALVAALAVAGCSDVAPTTQPTAGNAASPAQSLPDVPDREPDVTGVVGSTDEYPRAPYLVEPSDGYFLGMYLLEGTPAILGRDGGPLSPSDLSEGDPVAVWVDGGCRESFPVQCDVVALGVGPSD